MHRDRIVVGRTTDNRRRYDRQSSFNSPTIVCDTAYDFFTGKKRENRAYPEQNRPGVFFDSWVRGGERGPARTVCGTIVAGKKNGRGLFLPQRLGFAAAQQMGQLDPTEEQKGRSERGFLQYPAHPVRKKEEK